jgi:rhodanese-related sulfurtransferase
LKLNHALKPMSREQFIALVAEQPDAPRYFGFDAELNKRERATLDASLAHALEGLPLARFLALQAEGCQVIDTREPSDFAASHLAGSLNIGLSGKYATWVGSLVEPTRPILLVTEPGKERESAMRLGRIGFDQVAGTLAGGLASLAGRPDLLASWQRVSAVDLARRLAASDGTVVLDIRSAGEREGASIAGSIHVPLPHLEEHLDEIPRDAAVVVHCAGGFRSAIATSLLQAHGFTNVSDLEGGMSAWQDLQKQSASR